MRDGCLLFVDRCLMASRLTNIGHLLNTVTAEYIFDR